MNVSEMAEVWVVRGFASLPHNSEEPDIVYEHAFPTRDEAMAIQRRGELELPGIYWTLERMPFGQPEFAAYMFDQLKGD